MDALFVPGQGPSLIVALTSYGGHMQPARSFEWQRVLAPVMAHKLFLKDTHQHWYHGGLIGFSHSLDETVAAIRRTAETVGATRLMLLGSSMGAHGALLLGTLLQAARVLAISPQVNLQGEWLTAIGDARWPWKMAEIAWLGYGHLDLGAMYRTFTPPDTRIYFSANDALDYRHAQLITDQGVAHGVPVPNSNHELAYALARSGLITHIAADFAA